MVSFVVNFDSASFRIFTQFFCSQIMFKRTLQQQQQEQQQQSNALCFTSHFAYIVIGCSAFLIADCFTQQLKNYSRATALLYYTGQASELLTTEAPAPASRALTLSSRTRSPVGRCRAPCASRRSGPTAPNQAPQSFETPEAWCG